MTAFRFSGSFLQQDLAAPQASIRLYRPDIDGLKALAVLAVIATHYFNAFLPGGFAGVDVFFVISGYLIARSTFIEIHAGRYQVWRYFTRRIKRIFPALILLLVSLLMIGWWTLLPEEYSFLAKHAAGASVFISNWQFWREVGYWDVAAELKPLLNLWSLGVEEQFYLLFPLLVIASIRRRRGAFAVLAVAMVVSFAASLARVSDHASWAYYHLFSRLWELLVGALFAYAELSRLHTHLTKDSAAGTAPPAVSGRQHITSITGLALLIISFALIDKSLPFPAPWALLPTAGALLVIAAGPMALPNRRVLANPALVYVGLISYPLYLWHWPLLSLARIYDQSDPTLAIKLGLLVATFAISAACYHFLERPVRFGRWSKERWVPFTLILLLALTGAAALAIHRTGGVYSRFPVFDNVYQHPAAARVYVPPGFTAERKVALIGDSHAQMYDEALRSYYFQRGRQLVTTFRAGCRPFWNLDQHSPGYPPQGCPTQVNAALERIVADPAIETVIIVAQFQRLRDLIHPEAARLPEPLRSRPSSDEARNLALLELAMRQTLDMLFAAGKQVIVFTNTPELDFPPTKCQQRPLRLHQPAMEPCEMPRAEIDRLAAGHRQLLARVQADYPAMATFDPQAILCGESACRARVEGRLVYANIDHLNEFGAEVVIRGFAAQFADRAADSRH
jgi:peptidoglycan/LPS O-acetylase OafA/YrhL